MAKVGNVLAERFQKKENPSKMKALAQATASGDLSSFSGVFHLSELSDQEKEQLESLLIQHSEKGEDIQNDLRTLIGITSEVKAITNQAAILHGERIQRAHDILTRYRDGAFTSWLIATYGNRQTPYNFLQYYRFFKEMPQSLHPQIEKMPRQAVYSLASRSASIEKKQDFVKGYEGQTKEELMKELRLSFPLPSSDRRKQDASETFIANLQRLVDQLTGKPLHPSEQQATKIHRLLAELRVLVSTHE